MAPADAPRASIKEIADDLDMDFDEVRSYLDRTTGKVSTVSLAALSWAEEGDEESADRFPKWQQEELELAKQIVETDNFVDLPKLETSESWEIMQDFALAQTNDALCNRLLNAISGRGAFRCFKDIISDRNLWDAWNDFRLDALRKVAVEWCKDNDIPYKLD